jgi:hypothetical protein
VFGDCRVVVDRARRMTYFASPQGSRSLDLDRPAVPEAMGHTAADHRIVGYRLPLHRLLGIDRKVVPEAMGHTAVDHRIVAQGLPLHGLLRTGSDQGMV